MPDETSESEQDEEPRRPRFADGPPVEDPYATQDSGYILVPILVAVACFFPVVYCLCKM